MKILIHCADLRMGGVQKSLINFATELSKNNQVDIALFGKKGDLLNLVPDNINVYDCGDVSSFYTYSDNVVQYKITGVLKTILRKIGVKKFFLRYKEKVLKQHSNCLKCFDEYDVAVCFDSIDYLSLVYVQRFIKAKVKIAFFHGDPTMVYVNKDYLKYFMLYDKILTVSNSCQKKVKHRFQTLKNIDYLYNCQDVKTIVEKSKEELDIAFEKDKIKIITVARLDKNKNIICFVKALKKLEDEGYKFVYYVVGDGCQKKEIESFVKKNNMTNIHLLGSKPNPYKYIKECDLFVLPSRFEACPMVYAEAMTLGVPVLSTDTCSAREILDDWGFICENSKKGLYSSLKDLLENPSKIDEKKKKIAKEYHFSNEEIVQKVYNIVKQIEKNKG